MRRFVLPFLLLLPLTACIAFDPQNAAGYPSTAIRTAREACSMAWAKPVPDDSHWGAQLVGDHWRIWLKDHGGTPTCALGMVTVQRRTGVAGDCTVCPTL
jgi:hypothetical protein